MEIIKVSFSHLFCLNVWNKLEHLLIGGRGGGGGEKCLHVVKIIITLHAVIWQIKVFALMSLLSNSENRGHRKIISEMLFCREGEAITKLYAAMLICLWFCGLLACPVL